MPLPDPQFLDPPTWCLACGYALDGIPAPGACPECGQRFPAAYLVLGGIVQGSSRNRGRSALWIGLGAAWYILGSFGIMLAIMISPALALALVVVLVGSVVVMIMTSKRDRRGSEQLVFSHGVIGGRSIEKTKKKGKKKNAPANTAGEVDRIAPGLSFELRRVSPVWRSLRIGSANGNRVKSAVFRAGVRCTDQDEAMVRSAIADLLEATPVDKPLPPPVPIP